MSKDIKVNKIVNVRQKVIITSGNNLFVKLFVHVAIKVSEEPSVGTYLC